MTRFNLGRSCFVSFIVNLQNGTGSEAEVVLHFKPLYNENETSALLLNHRQNSSYSSNPVIYHNSLLPANSFSLLLNVTSEDFKVSNPGGHTGNTTQPGRFDFMSSVSPVNLEEGSALFDCRGSPNE